MQAFSEGVRTGSRTSFLCNDVRGSSGLSNAKPLQTAQLAALACTSELYHFSQPHTIERHRKLGSCHERNVLTQRLAAVFSQSTRSP